MFVGIHPVRESGDESLVVEVPDVDFVLFRDGKPC